MGPDPTLIRQLETQDVGPNKTRRKPVFDNDMSSLALFARVGVTFSIDERKTRIVNEHPLETRSTRPGVEDLHCEWHLQGHPGRHAAR